MSPIRLLSPLYEEPPAASGALAPRLATLAGARIGILDNDKPGAARLLDHVAALLAERHGAREAVRVRKASATRPAEAGDLERLQAGADAVVTAIGD
jgi:hypothetical protein